MLSEKIAGEPVFVVDVVQVSLSVNHFHQATFSELHIAKSKIVWRQFTLYALCFYQYILNAFGAWTSKLGNKTPSILYDYNWTVKWCINTYIDYKGLK